MAAYISGMSVEWFVPGQKEELLEGAIATPSLFATLDVQPLLGPGFPTDASMPTSAKVVVLSYSLWKARLGSDPTRLGARLALKVLGVDTAVTAYTVVGVMPKGFAFPSGAQLWIPVVPSATGDRGNRSLFVIARLKSSISLRHANAELGVIERQIAASYPKTSRNVGAVVTSLHEQLLENVSGGRFILLGAAACTLVVAVLNVMSLLLADGIARRREIAIRCALGASGRRIIGQFIGESICISLLGGVGGVLLAALGVNAASMRLHVSVMGVYPSLDARVLVFAAVVSVATGIVAGLMPAMQLTHIDTEAVLRGAGQIGGAIARRRVQDALIVVQIAAAAVLLTAAGRLTKQFVQLTLAGAGFDSHGLFVARVPLPTSGDGNQVAILRRLLDEARTTSGVGAATALVRDGASVALLQGGERVLSPQAQPELEGVSADFFKVLGLRAGARITTQIAE